MKDRDFPEGQESGKDADTGDIEFAAFEEMIQAGKAEQPEISLGNRVCAGLAYRRALMQTSSEPRRRAPILATACATLVAAACGLFFFHRVNARGNVRITPEPASTSGAASTRAAEKVPPAAPDPCLLRHSATGQQPIIDDFEDGDDEVSLFEGRSGLWRWVRDTDAAGTAPALLPIPRPNAQAGNRLAIHVKGGQLLDWGAVVEFSFVPSCYDASSYRGFSFQAKGAGRIFVGPREVSVIPIANGGTCREDCHNGHVKKINIDAQWRTYEVKWSEVVQRGYNKPPLDPSRLNSLAFLVHPEDTPYDLWLDDVKFLSR